MGNRESSEAAKESEPEEKPQSSHDNKAASSMKETGNSKSNESTHNASDGKASSNENQEQNTEEGHKKFSLGFISWFTPSKKDEKSEKEEDSKKEEQKEEEMKFAAEDGVTLYSGTFCAASRRIRMVLIQKKIPFTEVRVNTLLGEEQSTGYLEVNPSGEVPSLCFKGVKGIADCVLNQPRAVTFLLDSLYPTKNKLYPANMKDLCIVHMWEDWEASLAPILQEMMRVTAVPFVLRAKFGALEKYLEALPLDVTGAEREECIRVYSGDYLPTPEDREALASLCLRCLLKLEHSLVGQEYLIGDEITMADLCVYPLAALFNWCVTPFKREQFPSVHRYLRAMEDHTFVNDSDTDKAWRRLLSWFPWFVIKFGNWRSGLKQSRYIATEMIPKVLEEDDLGHILEPALIPDVPERMTIIYPYYLAAESWQVQMALRLKGLSYKEEDCDVLDLVGRPTGVGDIHKIQHGDQLFVGALTSLHALDHFTDTINLLPTDSLEKAECIYWQTWERDLYADVIYPLFESRVLSMMMAQRFGGARLQAFHELRDNPNYTPYFRELLRTLYIGFKDNPRDRKRLEDGFPNLKEESTENQGDPKQLLYRLRHLEDTIKEKQFLVGNRCTLADICVYCRLLLLSLIKVELPTHEFPGIIDWMSRMGEIGSQSDVTEEILSSTTSVNEGENQSIPEAEQELEPPVSPLSEDGSESGTESRHQSMSSPEVQQITSQQSVSSSDGHE